MRGGGLLLAMCAIIGVTQSGPARAEADAKTFLAQIDLEKTPGLYTYVLNGYSNGLSWANTELAGKGLRPLYCPPGKLSITASQNADILRQYLKRHPADAVYPAGLVMKEALKETFPCDANGQPRP